LESIKQIVPSSRIMSYTVQVHVQLKYNGNDYYNSKSFQPLGDTSYRVVISKYDDGVSRRDDV